tara:strand:+ start:1015 stop:1932 length:918 start_codon:yes stop_codon:yes gene_type:complete
MSIGKQDLQELAQGLGEYQQRYATNLARTEALMGDPSRLNALLEMQQPKGPKQPSSVQEFLFYRQQGGMDDFATFLSKKGGGSNITLNTGPQGQNFGSPPKDMEWVRDATGKVVIDERGIPKALPIEGTKTYIEQEKILEGKKSSASTDTSSAENVLLNVERIRDRIKESTLLNPGTGFLAETFVNIGGTLAADIKALVSPIKASIGFDRLQKMREESPTGGALGQVSEMELDLLNSSLQSLDQSQSQEQFLENLDEVEKRYSDIVTKLNAYPDEIKIKVGYTDRIIPTTEKTDDELMKEYGEKR